MTAFRMSARVLFAGLLVGLPAGCSSNSADPTRNTGLNCPPSLVALGDTLAAPGDTLHLQARAHDIDGDSLAYELTVFLSHLDIVRFHHPAATIDAATGLFRFVPAVADCPGREFRIIARDPHGAADSCEFGVTVACSAGSGQAFPAGGH